MYNELRVLFVQGIILSTCGVYRNTLGSTVLIVIMRTVHSDGICRLRDLECKFSALILVCEIQVKIVAVGGVENEFIL